MFFFRETYRKEEGGYFRTNDLKVSDANYGSLSRIDVFGKMTKNAIAIAVIHSIIKARYVYGTL